MIGHGASTMDIMIMTNVTALRKLALASLLQHCVTRLLTHDESAVCLALNIQTTRGFGRHNYKLTSRSLLIVILVLVP